MRTPTGRASTPPRQSPHRARPQPGQHRSRSASPSRIAELYGRRERASGSGSSLPARHGQNNPAIVIGRKSWLFAGSDRGGERASAMFTLIETAKLNGLDPQAWLTDVLSRIADHPASRLDQLLPWRWKNAGQAIAA